MTLPLVLIHGFTGTPASWDSVARTLQSPPFCPSPLGHGPPDELEDRVRSWDDEILRLMAAMPAEPVHLAGYSLGARLALGIAVAFPEHVAALTLVSGHTGLASSTERDERRASDARWCTLLETAGIEAFVNAWDAEPLFLTQAALPAELRARRRAERLSHRPEGLARALRVLGLSEMPDYGPRLSSLTMPVTVMAGELDSKFLSLGRATSARLPQGRFVVAPNAGHDLLLEHPSLVTLVLREAIPKTLGITPS